MDINIDNIILEEVMKQLTENADIKNSNLGVNYVSQSQISPMIDINLGLFLIIYDCHNAAICVIHDGIIKSFDICNKNVIEEVVQYAVQYITQ